MELMPWKSFKDLASLRNEINKFFDEFFKKTGKFIPKISWSPSIDVHQTENEVVARMEVPGVSKEQICLSVTENMLTISGEKKQAKEVKKQDFYSMESRFGKFERNVTLPVPVKPEKAKATYKDGVLEVKIPKAVKPVPKGRSIKIE